MKTGMEYTVQIVKAQTVLVQNWGLARVCIIQSNYFVTLKDYILVQQVPSGAWIPPAGTIS